MLLWHEIHPPHPDEHEPLCPYIFDEDEPCICDDDDVYEVWD
jgi:hypothetical protein